MIKITCFVARYAHNQKMLANMQHETAVILEQAFAQRGIPKVICYYLHYYSNWCLIGYHWIDWHCIGRETEKPCIRAAEKNSGELLSLILYKSIVLYCTVDRSHCYNT